MDDKNRPAEASGCCMQPTSQATDPELRDAADARRALREFVQRKRTEWAIDTARVLNRTATFAMELGRGLGEISRDEAITVLQAEFTRLTNELR